MTRFFLLSGAAAIGLAAIVIPHGEARADSTPECNNGPSSNAVECGVRAEALSTAATALGANTYAVGEGATAVGRGAFVDGSSSTAVGRNAHARTIGSIAIGS